MAEDETKAAQGEISSASRGVDVQSMIEAHSVLLIGTSTCPFCIEAKRTLQAHGVAGRFFDADKEPNTSQTRKAVAQLTGKTSVPQIWIKKRHIGGCDNLKTLDAAGELAVELSNLSFKSSTVAEAEEGSPTFEKVGGHSADSAAVTTYPGPTAAFWAPFHSPATVDHRVVRVNGCVTFAIAVVTAIFAKRDVTEWVVFGLFIDFAFKLTGLPSPVGLLSALPFAGTKPQFCAGASKQFANLCGIFMAFVAWLCLLGDKPLGAQIVLAMLAVAAFLQGFADFCLGCFIFEYLIKFNLVSKAVYRMHVNTRANTAYAWDKTNDRTFGGSMPDPVTFPTKGLPANPTDLRAKPVKADEKWEFFGMVKYCHVSYFMMPLSVLGLALPWNLLSDTVGTANGPWQALAWAGTALQVLFLCLYLAKCLVYPNKVRKEFHHPLTRNSFALPFLNFVLMAWLTTKWTSADFSGDLAKVFFWIGTAPLAVLTQYLVASWIAVPVDQEHVNPSWMIMPVGNLVGAIAARPVDAEYVEWGWFLFGVGVLLWLALWPMTFRGAISDHHSDVRVRSLYGIWIAPPAVAFMAYTSLQELTSFDPIQKILFYAAVSMFLVLSFCVWPLNFFLEGKFDMSDWTFAFPLDALAAAAVLVYGYTGFETMKVLYAVGLSAACLVNAINFLQTLGALKAKKIFTPAAKWSPMSFMRLTHEAFREAVPKLDKLAAAAKPGVGEASSLRELASTWSALAKAHEIHSNHEDKIIFPELDAYFPGQTHSSSEEHEAHEALMHAIQAAIDTLVGGGDGADDDASRTALLERLRADVERFGKELLEHLDREEHAYATPVARKFLPIAVTKSLARRSWDITNNREMSEFLAWMMTNLRARGQRTRYLKTWVWSMPERAQQLGLMVYRVVDDVTWLEVARDIPEAIPRGLPGYKRYY